MEEIDQKLEEDHPNAIDHSDNDIDDDDTQRDVEDDEGEEENASENEEEGEGEKDTVEDEDQFRFCDGVNPLDFIHDNNSSIQLYQKLEELEYEAKANKKRKATQQCLL